MEPKSHADFEHTGPSTPAGRLLRRFWQPVFVSEDLKPAHTVPLKVMNDELTLYRGEDGVPRIVEGRCAHRGVLLSVGQVEGDPRCFYHGLEVRPPASA
jgi:5,5'-dehydrodivanillate O-demethylase